MSNSYKINQSNDSGKNRHLTIAWFGTTEEKSIITIIIISKMNSNLNNILVFCTQLINKSSWNSKLEIEFICVRFISVQIVIDETRDTYFSCLLLEEGVDQIHKHCWWRHELHNEYWNYSPLYSICDLYSISSDALMRKTRPTHMMHFILIVYPFLI